MNKQIKCIMLIDDNPHDNFYHERIIDKGNWAETVIAMESAGGALGYIRSKTEPFPDLIFLDINMPGMNGWDFLNEYTGLDGQSKNPVIVMLTTSENPDDEKKAMDLGCVTDFKTKPLTQLMLEEIFHKHFEKSAL